MSSLLRRFLLIMAVVLGAVLPARADRAEDLARIHLEAIGGKQRIDALATLRASGVAFAGGKQVRFTMVAARPARVRIETEGGGRTLIQASDGAAPPWEFDSSAAPVQYRAMPETSARTFVNDAEFDDPLVTGVARGFTMDYAGEIDVNGRKLHRILLTRKMTEPFSVLVDDETFFIVMRVELRKSAAGRTLQVVTHFEDFRPVNGVIFPYQITLTIDGQVKQQTKITKMEANPEVAADAFTRPVVVVPGLAAP